MHPISLIFLGLCAFLLGFWLVRKLENRRAQSSGYQGTLPPSTPIYTNPASPAANSWKSPPTRPPEPTNAQPAVELAQPVDTPSAPAPIEHPDIRDLILENRQSEAIQLLHKHKGWDLGHATEYVAQQEKRQSSQQLDPEVVAAAKKLLAENRKIVAIKLIYKHTGWSLKAAKDYVENSL
ncbi:MAG: hypothetical protein VKJ09_14495 [Leptolyngbya sp.]|nr:hypothetical protein [Leptolyngbya sp.]